MREAEGLGTETARDQLILSARMCCRDSWPLKQNVSMQFSLLHRNSFNRIQLSQGLSHTQREGSRQQGAVVMSPGSEPDGVEMKATSVTSLAAHVAVRGYLVFLHLIFL